MKESQIRLVARTLLGPQKLKSFKRWRPIFFDHWLLRRPLFQTLNPRRAGSEEIHAGLYAFIKSNNLLPNKNILI